MTGLGILFFSGGACCPCAFIPCCVDDFMVFFIFYFLDTQVSLAVLD